MKHLNTIKCAADVRKAFPDASITEQGLSCMSSYISYDVRTAKPDPDPDFAIKDELTLDGHFSPTQVFALAYWLEHKEEFAKDA